MVWSSGTGRGYSIALKMKIERRFSKQEKANKTEEGKGREEEGRSALDRVL